VNKDLEKMACRHTRDRCDGDDPGTLYECPVCLEGVELRDVSTNLRAHKGQGELTDSLADEIEGLRYVANKVMATYASRLKILQKEKTFPGKPKIGARKNPVIKCPICSDKMRVVDYVEHWKTKHVKESARTEAGRKRVQKYYDWSKRIGGKIPRVSNPIRKKKGNRMRLGKGPPTKIVRGGLPSLGKRR